MRSLLIIAALIGVAIGGVVWALSARQPPKVEKRAEPVLAVKAFRPALGEHSPALFLIGKVEARDYATLTAPTEADVLAIRAREGDYFRADEELLTLDRRDLLLSAEREKAALAQLRADLDANARNRRNDIKRLRETSRLLELATADHERNVALLAKDVVSETQLEGSEQTLLMQQLSVTALENQVANYVTQRQSLEARLAAARAQLEQTLLLIERAKMRAPFAGRVAKMRAAVGARAARGAPLLDIFNPADLRLRVAVPQRHIADVKAGKGARALLTENGETLTLSLAGLEPSIETGNSGIDTFFKLPPGDWVLGAVRDVIIELPPVDAAPAPVDALYNDQFVYRIDADNRAEALDCEPRGLTRHEGRVDILVSCPGLRPDDRLIANQLPNLLGGALLTVVAWQ